MSSLKHLYIIVIFVSGYINATVVVALEVSLCENAIPPWVINDNDEVAENSILRLFTDAVFDKVEDVSVKYLLLPWSRCQDKVQRGLIDGTLFMYITDERKKIYQFSEITIAYPAGFLYSKVKYPNGIFINHFSEITQYRIGLLRGYAYVPEIVKMLQAGLLNYEIVSNSEQNYKKLLAGRVDIIEDGIVNAKYDLRMRKLDHKVGINQGSLVMLGEMAYSFNKQSPVIQFLPAINKAINELRAIGYHIELLERDYVTVKLL